MKKMVMVVAVMASVVVSSFAREGAGNGQGRNGGEGHGNRMAQELNLSEEQQAEMKVLREKQQANRDNGTREQYKAVMDEMNQLLLADNVDQSAVDAQIDKIAELTKAKMQKHTAHLLEVKEVLTPEQFAKFIEMKKERARGGHHNRNGENGQCRGGDEGNKPNCPKKK